DGHRLGQHDLDPLADGLGPHRRPRGPGVAVEGGGGRVDVAGEAGAGPRPGDRAVVGAAEQLVDDGRPVPAVEAGLAGEPEGAGGETRRVIRASASSRVTSVGSWRCRVTSTVSGLSSDAAPAASSRSVGSAIVSTCRGGSSPMAISANPTLLSPA